MYVQIVSSVQHKKWVSVVCLLIKLWARRWTAFLKTSNWAFNDTELYHPNVIHVSVAYLRIAFRCTVWNLQKKKDKHTVLIATVSTDGSAMPSWTTVLPVLLMLRLFLWHCCGSGHMWRYELGIWPELEISAWNSYATLLPWRCCRKCTRRVGWCSADRRWRWSHSVAQWSGTLGSRSEPSGYLHSPAW